MFLRDTLAPLCGFGIHWCVVGVEAVILIAIVAVCTAVGRFTRRNWRAVAIILGVLAFAALVGSVT